MKTACSKPTSWLALSACLLVPVMAQGVRLYTSDTDEPEPRQSEITISYASPSVDENDNPAAVAKSLGLEDKNQSGIGRLYMENSADSAWRVYLDSRIMLDPDEIAFSLEAFKAESFYINIDFQHWIEWDHGAGIYYPATDAFHVLSPEALDKEIDKFQVTLRYTPSMEVEWKLDYSFFNRDGSSLSTSFGDDYQYIIGRTRSRGIVPGLVEGEETVQTLDLRVQRNEPAMRTGVRAFAQDREVIRERVVERAASQPAANRYTRQEETSKDDLYGFSGYIRYQISDTTTGSLGLALTRMDGDITGSRVFGANPESAYDIDFAATQLEDRGYLDLDATRRLKQWIFNANLVREGEGNFRWMTGFRMEHLTTELFSSYIDTYDTIDFGDLERQDQENSMTATSDKSVTDLSAFLEVRYKGIPKALVYSRLEGARQTGDLAESWSSEELVPNPASAISLLDRATGFDKDSLFWETGVNYYPTTRLKISLEGYLKQRDHQYDYDKVILAPTDPFAYPAYITEQTFYTRDVNARLHWRILDSLKIVSRFDLQVTEIDSTGRDTAEIRSSERERMVYNQSLTWTPHPRFFVNAAYTLVDDLEENTAAELQGHFSGIVLNLPNDYWQADIDLFYVVSKFVDIQLGYHYLKMSNYLDNSPATVPYGSDLEQHQAMGTLIFHLGAMTTARIGYAYYEQTDLRSAGFRDYTVHVLSGSLQRKF